MFVFRLKNGEKNVKIYGNPWKMLAYLIKFFTHIIRKRLIWNSIPIRTARKLLLKRWYSNVIIILIFGDPLNRSLFFYFSIFILLLPNFTYHHFIIIWVLDTITFYGSAKRPTLKLAMILILCVIVIWVGMMKPIHGDKIYFNFLIFYSIKLK